MAQLERLRYFVAVAEERHFGRAAQRLLVAQPSLSQQIKRLEAELGTALLHRDARAVRLTPAGEALLEHARPAIAAVDEALAAARRAAAGDAVPLRIGFLPAAVGALMGEIVRGFGARHPEVAVELVPHDFTDTSAGLRSGSVDAAFVRLPIRDDGLRFAALVSEPRVMALPPGHPLAARASISIEEVLDEPWVVVPDADPVWREFWLATAHRDGRPPHLGPTAADPDASFEAVLAGQGLLLTRASIALRYHAEGVAIVPVVDVEPSVGAIAWRVAHEPPVVRAFVDEARAHAA
jgi:DNA-binding transcriptional LysR family regulator